MKKVLLLAALLSGSVMANYDSCHDERVFETEVFGNRATCFDVSAIQNITDYGVNITTVQGHSYVLMPLADTDIKESERPVEVTVLAPELFLHSVDSNGKLYIIEASYFDGLSELSDEQEESEE